jgi:hypothetical protein
MKDISRGIGASKGAVRGRHKAIESINVRVPVGIKGDLDEIATKTGTNLSTLGREGFRLVIQKFRKDGHLVLCVQEA